ncbi:hypothetical protein [uncultured Shimia sp.]|uniref:hypothetical protein n=1 Tax=uncultured Shimia sp. TaxID=573152 RepID=UPI00260B6902|nr:hypothetical protein [uncultured Shimia sp.]
MMLSGHAATRFLLIKWRHGQAAPEASLKSKPIGVENALEVDLRCRFSYSGLFVFLKMLFMFAVLTLAVLVGVMAALTSYLQYDAIWWKGILWSALIMVFSLGLIAAGGHEPAISDNPLIVSASIGMAAAILLALVSLATIVARKRFSERQTVSAAFCAGMVLFLVGLF